MPDVYDPTGGSMFRSRRRRKRNAERPKPVDGGKPKTNASASRTQTSALQKTNTPRDESFEFGSEGELKNRTKGTKRKQSVRARSNDTNVTTITPIDPRTLKRGKEDSLHKPASTTHHLPTISESSLSARRRSYPKRDNCTSSTENCFQYSIALDTRHVDTEAGKDDQQDFLQNAKDFLWTTFRRRGFSTPTVTWTESCSSNDTTNIRIRSESTSRDNSDDVWSSVNGLPVPSSLEDEVTKMSGTTRLPKGLLAHSSWKIVGDLVEATIDGINPFTPLKFVVFTSAASFLLDDNSTNHASGIDAFWEKSQQYFRDSRVQSIEIVVVMGETIIERTTKDRRDTTPRNDSLLDDSDAEKLNTEKVGVEKCLTSSMASQIGILKTIKRHIESKVEDDLETTRNRLHLDLKMDGNQLPVNISISAVDVAVDFPSLCQKWSRESLHSATVSKLGQTSPMISFELPETADFDACDISFAAYYKNMPFRVDSPQALRLYEDLILLSETTLQVVQLLPVSSIDASLIYGVTIGLRCAHENNEESHQEKNYLVQSLFHRLATRDCALLLRSNNGQDLGHYGNPRFDGLFHSSKERQLFLFMPEFAVSKEGPVAPKSGVLSRVSSVDHILQDASTSDLLKPIHPPHVLLGAQESRLGSNPFSDYVEDSLDSLHCSPLNPWIQGRVNKSAYRPDIAEEQKQAPRESDGSPKSCKWKGETFAEDFAQVAQQNTCIGNEKEVPSDKGSIGSDVSVSDESEMSVIVKEAVVSNSKNSNKEYNEVAPAKDHRQKTSRPGSSALSTAENMTNANRQLDTSSSSSCSSSSSSESSFGDFYY